MEKQECGSERQRGERAGGSERPRGERAGGSERQRGDKWHLPRLRPEWYRGFAMVQWTQTTDRRTTGWLDERFHANFREVHLHACARFHLLSPAYVLMPDHFHLLWIGLSDDADQRVAMEFLRKHLAPHLAPHAWQTHPHDHVLREEERRHASLQNRIAYLLDNPVRAQLVRDSCDYPYLGSCVPGYPEFDPRMEDFWMRLWRCYNYLVGGPEPEGKQGPGGK